MTKCMRNCGRCQCCQRAFRTNRLTQRFCSPICRHRDQRRRLTAKRRAYQHEWKQRNKAKCRLYDHRWRIVHGRDAYIRAYEREILATEDPVLREIRALLLAYHRRTHQRSFRVRDRIEFLKEL